MSDRTIRIVTTDILTQIEAKLFPKILEDSLKDREHFRKAILIPFVTEGLLALTIPVNPSSAKQQYITVEKRGKLLKDMEEN